MKSYLIKDTTMAERIELIRQWVPQDDGFEECEIDLWKMYDPYIKGVMEISECNAAFNEGFYEETDMKKAPGCGQGTTGR